MLKIIFRLSGFKLGLVITLLFCSIKLPICGLSDAGAFKFLETVENAWLDWKFNLRLGRDSKQKAKEFQEKAHVVIVAVDEKSIRTEGLGAWPWPRLKMAELAQNLDRCGADVIGFDMVFAEADSSRVQPVVQDILARYAKVDNKDQGFENELRQILEQTHGDRILAQALEEVEGVVLGYFFFINQEEVQKLDEAEIQAGKDSIGFGTVSYTVSYPNTSAADAFPKALGVRANISALSEAVEYYGYFNQLPDDDRIYRHVPMIFSYDGDLYPSLPLQVLSSYFRQPVVVLAHTLTKQEYIPGHVGLFLGPIGMPGPKHRHIPVERGGRFRVNFYGRQKTFLHVSAGDIIQGDERACAAVRGKIVLVGVTTIGIYDLRPTPFDHSYPGVEIHASVIENVINGDFMRRPSFFLAWEVLFIFFVGLVLSLLLNHIRLTWGLVVTVLFMVGLGLADYVFLFLNGYQAHVLLPEMHLVILFTGVSVYRYATVEREKSKIRHAFQFYLSRSVIDTMLQDTSKLKLGGERRELTVLFSDIRGFTTISEKLQPEALAELLNEYFTPMTEIVFQHKGTLDKYIGDAVMAIFGAPFAYQDHAGASCMCALDMMSELGKLQKSWEERGLPVLDIGIGINTGFMSVGNMGSASLFDYTVIGDHVNLGSRLEGLNKTYTTHIIVSEYTYAQLADQFTFRELDVVKVKGKLESVRIYELLNAGSPDPTTDTWLEPFHQALSAYQERKWDRAMEMFEALTGDAVSRMYLERCRMMKKYPPGQDWDGAFELDTK